MLLGSLIAVVALVGVMFMVYAYRAFDWDRWGAGILHSLLALVFLLVAAVLGVVTFALRTYQGVGLEANAAEVQVRELDKRKYTLMVTYPTKQFQVYDIAGDEWQIEARVITWKGLARLLGFDTVYRLERVQGRYKDIDSEKSAQRTVHALQPPDRIDFFEMVKKAKEYLPGIDAIYGSAVFLPMADNALYEVTVSPTGLVARPVNEEAKKAVGAGK